MTAIRILSVSAGAAWNLQHHEQGKLASNGLTCSRGPWDGQAFPSLLAAHWGVGGRVDSHSASIGQVLGISGPAHKCFHGASPVMATVKWEAGVVGWGGLRSRRPLSHGCYAQPSLDVVRSHLCLV